MIFNFNFEPSFIKRAVVALESLATNYAIVHAGAIESAQLSKAVDEKVGKSYYQSDRAVYEAEQEQKIKDAINRGDVE